MLRLFTKVALAGLTGAVLGGLLAGIVSITGEAGLALGGQAALASLLVCFLTIGLCRTLFGFLFRGIRSNSTSTLAGLVLGGVGLLWWFPSQGADPYILAVGAGVGGISINVLAFLRLPRRSSSRGKLAQAAVEKARQVAEKGSPTEAALAYTEAFQLAENLLGSRHPVTLEAVIGLAESRLAAGANEQARTLLSEIEASVEELFGDPSDLLAAVLEGLGRVSQGEQAVVNLERAISIREKLDDPARTAEAICRLAQVLLAQERQQEALEKFSAAEQIGEPPAECWLEWGVALKQAGRAQEAAEKLRRVSKSPGLNDRLKARAYLHLAEVESKKATGHYLKALKLLQFGDEEFDQAFLGHARCQEGSALEVFLLEVLEGKIPEVEEWATYQGPEGWTPLHWAAARGHLEVVNWLLERGARPADGRIAPLHLACVGKHVEVATRLVETGADLETRDSYHLRSPLFFAVMARQLELVRLLADEGADVDTEDGFGQRPVHYAAFSGQPEVIELLGQLGADLDAADDKTGQTALHVAVARNRPECVRALLKLGVDVLVREKQAGWTPLEMARQTGQSELVSLLESA